MIGICFCMTPIKESEESVVSRPANPLRWAKSWYPMGMYSDGIYVTSSETLCPASFRSEDSLMLGSRAQGAIAKAAPNRSGSNNRALVRHLYKLRHVEALLGIKNFSNLRNCELKVTGWGHAFGNKLEKSSGVRTMLEAAKTRPKTAALSWAVRLSLFFLKTLEILCFKAWDWNDWIFCVKLQRIFKDWDSCLFLRWGFFGVEGTVQCASGLLKSGQWPAVFRYTMHLRTERAEKARGS